MSDTVIVFVTRTGNSRILATKLGAIIGAPVYEIVDLANRKGAFRFMLGGAQASRKGVSPIVDPQVPLKGIQTLILVQPVWASNLCPPLRTWLNGHRSELYGVRLALLASHMGSPPERFRSNVEKELGKLESVMCIRESLDFESKTAALGDFASSIGVR